MTIRAAVYCRMSLASMDDTTKVDDQERLCRATAERLGWEVVEVYQDNNRSAWRHNRKRPAWDRMLADIEAGKINAIVVYHGDRLTRQPMDLEILIALSRTRGIKLASGTGVRDLNDDDDQFTLGIEANVYRKESAATSRRRKMQYERWRREGRVRPGGRGGRAYGFATDGVSLVAAEVAVIQDAARRVLAGESAGQIARDLTARGHHTPAGNPFTHGTLRKMLARPRYAGLMPDGVHPAAWPPVLDQETWEAVGAVLAAKAAGFSYTTNARRYLLSGIAKCSECGSGLQVRVESRRTHLTGYGCVKHGCRKVQRSMELLDEYVITRVLKKLGDPANPPGRVLENKGLAAELRMLTIERAATEERVRDPSRGGHVDALLDRLDAIDKRIAQLRELAAGNASARLLGAHAGITRPQWDALPLGTRRALVAALFTVVVLPASKRGPGFRTEDVRVTGR
jgi:DNA invertase Pin-like site-specific DNA recombinase